ncbi:hypothetical protein NQZ68_001455 [Dissostichus eleginoides]|nr:hypothetical protein NQZ68_001455 [Dissostichus eleginoides]
MGTSQLSGSPTLNTTSQTSEGIPGSNLGAPLCSGSSPSSWGQFNGQVTGVDTNIPPLKPNSLAAFSSKTHTNPTPSSFPPA